MQEDLKVKVYNNGDPIFLAQTPEAWESFGKRKIGCLRILKNGTYIYNGYAIDDKRGIIPTGFELPTSLDFKSLFKFLGGGESQAGKASLSLASYPIFVEEWVGGSKGGLDFVEKKSNNRSGFSAKSGGFVYDHGGLENMFDHANCSFWWTSTPIKIEHEDGTLDGRKVVDIGYCSQDLGGGEQDMSLRYGFAIRAIRK